MAVSDPADNIVVSPSNQGPLEYWRSTGYTREDVDMVCRDLDHHALAMRVSFIPNQGLEVTVANRVVDTGQGHALSCIRYLEKVVKNWQAAPLRGAVIIYLEDGLWPWHIHHARHAPVLSFGRHYSDVNSFLIPDPAYMQSLGYENDRQMIDEIESILPWDQKKPTLFWRGAGSGLGTESSNDDWLKTARVRLTLASKDYGDLDKFDACISKIPNFDDEQHRERMRALGVAPYQSFGEFLRYRYLIDVDGMACAWISLFLKMYSKSTVVKVRGDYEQWYYWRLQPWQHFVPLRSDLTDLHEMINWLNNHQSTCIDIAERGRQVVQEMSFQKALDETGMLLSAILACQRYS